MTGKKKVHQKRLTLSVTPSRHTKALARLPNPVSPLSGTLSYNRPKALDLLPQYFIDSKSNCLSRRDPHNPWRDTPIEGGNATLPEQIPCDIDHTRGSRLTYPGWRFLESCFCR